MNKVIVLWNVAVENRHTQTPEEVRKRVMSKIRERNGGILLAHDGGLDRTLTVQSLPLILDDLQKEGFQIVPLEVYLKARTVNSVSRNLSFIKSIQQLLQPFVADYPPTTTTPNFNNGF